jgi:hypothetical protein
MKPLNLIKSVVKYLFFITQQPLVDQGFLIIETSRSHTKHRKTGQSSSARDISLTPAPLPDNTQRPQETDNHFSGGIRTHNSSKRMAAGPRLRARGHWNRLNICLLNAKVHAMSTLLQQFNRSKVSCIISYLAD